MLNPPDHPIHKGSRMDNAIQFQTRKEKIREEICSFEYIK